MANLYTVVAINKIVDDLKRVLFRFKLSTIVLYMVYLGYQILTAKGYVAIKLLLLGASVAYLVFYVRLHDRVDKPSRDARRRSDKIYRVVKIALNGLTLALTVHGFLAATSSPTVWSVMLAVLMAIGWTISILLELIYGFVASRVELIKEAIEMDKEALLKPVTTVKDVVGKLLGREKEEKPEPTKARKRLMKYAEESRAEKEKEREMRREEKLRKRAEKKKKRADKADAIVIDAGEAITAKPDAADSCDPAPALPSGEPTDGKGVKRRRRWSRK